MIRVLLVDDQTIVREGIATLLMLTEGIEIVAQAANGQECLNIMEDAPVGTIDVVLMDIRMPEMDGIEALKTLRRFKSTVPVVLLTTFMDPVAINNGMRFGAKGCLLKDVSTEELLAALHAVASGETYFAENAIPNMKDNLFNEREIAILDSLCAGLRNQEIAEKLHLSVGTIKNYLSTIFTKLEVSNRTQAIVKAKEEGVIAN